MVLKAVTQHSLALPLSPSTRSATPLSPQKDGQTLWFPRMHHALANLLSEPPPSGTFSSSLSPPATPWFPPLHSPPKSVSGTLQASSLYLLCSQEGAMIVSREGFWRQERGFSISTSTPAALQDTVVNLQDELSWKLVPITPFTFFTWLPGATESKLFYARASRKITFPQLSVTVCACLPELSLHLCGTFLTTCNGHRE